MGTADRLVDVLEQLAPGPLTLTELARRADLPLTSAHRLVARLLDRGVVERDDGGRLVLGLRLWTLASRTPRGPGLREVALPYLEDLYEATHENVQLAVRDGHEVVYVERIAGRSAVGVLTQVGLRFALPATGVGLVLLAFAPAEVQAQVLAGRLRAYTPHTVVDPRRLRAVLAEVRAQGYAVSDRQVTADAQSVAAPVRGRDDAVVAAVSVVVPVEGWAPQTLVPAVRAAAAGIGRGV